MDLENDAHMTTSKVYPNNMSENYLKPPILQEGKPPQTTNKLCLCRKTTFPALPYILPPWKSPSQFIICGEQKPDHKNGVTQEMTGLFCVFGLFFFLGGYVCISSYFRCLFFVEVFKKHTCDYTRPKEMALCWVWKSKLYIRPTSHQNTHHTYPCDVCDGPVVVF